MSRRFETNYRLKSGDNLGDPEFWNRRLEDIDRRVDGNEQALSNVDSVADRIEATALQRLDNVITPLVIEARDRVGLIPSLFTANSSTQNTVADGYMLFVIADGQRTTFAHQGYVGVNPTGIYSVGMLGKVESFDRSSGEIVITVESHWGSGTFTNWVIGAAQPYGAHAYRLDNPHNTTAHQVGTYTSAEIDQNISQAKTDLVGGASTATNTFGKVEARVTTLIGTASSAADTLGKLEATATLNRQRATDDAVAMAIALG